MNKSTHAIKSLLPASIIPGAIFLTAAILAISACTQQSPQTLPQTLVTIADARSHPAQMIDIGKPGDSPGDILVFDQPLLDKNMKQIGNNSGTCIRTRPGFSFQCQWTLTFGNEIKTSGSIQVAGRDRVRLQIGKV